MQLHRARLGLGGVSSQGFPEAYTGEGLHGEELGATDPGAAAGRDRRVRDALRVELDVGWDRVGAPMICWPLYAEQRTNKVHMVEEMKIGVVMEGYEKVVKAEEVEAKVRMVMDSEEGKKLRERLVVAKEMASDEIKGGGASDLAFDEFLKALEERGNAELGS